MKTLFIDIETFSSVNIKESGLYKYVESPDFEILLFGYAFNGENVQVLDLTKQELPFKLVQALRDHNITKVAQNSYFEVACLEKYLGESLDIRHWHDTMIMAYYLSLPGSLEAYGKILKLKEKKAATGKSLINYFSVPCTPTRSNSMRTRNLPEHDPEKWDLYIEYNMQDVESEREAYYKLLPLMPPEDVWCEWWLDQKINTRGVKLDKEFIEAAQYLAAKRTEELMEEAKLITGLDNPNSTAQLKAWLSEVEGEEIKSVAKDAGLEVANPRAIRMMEIRKELGKSSISKYSAMEACICGDDRARGLLQFYGTHTGRYAGRLIQVQNLPRNFMKGLDEARRIVKLKDYELMKMLYDNPTSVLSQLIRTAIIPSSGRKFIVVDYASIEARVISWLANEKWQIDVFKTSGLIYEATASQMFNIPMEEITKDLRQRGKVATLALGYQGAKGALVKMGALNMGIEENELSEIVSKWRRTNPNIVKLWKDTEACTKRAILEAGVKMSLPQNTNIWFIKKAGMLEIRLPSGRSLMYPGAAISDSGSIYYMGYKNEEGSTGKKVWGRVDTYGGALVENIVQAIARDCLQTALERLDIYGYNIVFHVHDEIIIDALQGEKLEDVIEIASKPIDWAPGLYLTLAGFEADYYQKD